jgi:hypothetical protein
MHGLINFGGPILKTFFRTATISDIHELHNVFDDLQTRNSDIVHSLNNQLSYLKMLDNIAVLNANAITNLSALLKTT